MLCKNTVKLTLRAFFMLLSFSNGIVHNIGGFNILFQPSDALKKKYHVWRI